jgi:hypothetical protein
VISYSGSGWNPQIDSDCVFTGSGACEQQWGWDITGAYKHYWLPVLSSAVYGSYLEMHYPADALAGFGGAVGVSNLKEARVGTNLVWTPLKGFRYRRRVHVCASQSDAAGWSRSRFDPHRNRPARVPAQYQPILGPPANPARVLKHLEQTADTATAEDKTLGRQDRRRQERPGWHLRNRF